MITYQQARKIALDAVKEDWGIGRGEPYAAPVGWENDQAYAVPVNSKEYLVNGDKRFMVLDAPIVLVHKGHGYPMVVQFLEAEQQISAMKPVNVG